MRLAILISIITVMFLDPALSVSNTCSSFYNLSADSCAINKRRDEREIGISAATQSYANCMDAALARQTCCNMQYVVDTKNDMQDKGWYVVKNGSQCSGIANKNEKPECKACETKCMEKMREAGGIASSCKSLCANNNRLQCKD